jgi:hypothetical protein
MTSHSQRETAGETMRIPEPNDDELVVLLNSLASMVDRHERSFEATANLCRRAALRIDSLRATQAELVKALDTTDSMLQAVAVQLVTWGPRPVVNVDGQRRDNATLLTRLRNGG